jgi:hypothetical protein
MGKKTRSILTVIVIGIVSAVLGYNIGKADILMDLVPENYQITPLFIFLIFAGIYIVLLVHELGHLLTGLALGFEFNKLTVGFLGLRKTDDGKTEWHFNKEMQYFGGIAITVPRKDETKAAEKFAKIIIAGPLSSAGLALLLVLASLILPVPFGFLAILIAIFSMFIFFATTIPGKSGAFYSDRKRYQRLKSQGKSRQIELALMDIMVYKAAHPEKPYPDEARILLLTEDEAAILKSTGFYYLYEFHLQNENKRSEILKKMKALEDDLPKAVVMQLKAEIEKLNKRL